MGLNPILLFTYAQHTSTLKSVLPAFLQPGTLAVANAFDISNVVWALGDRQLQVPERHVQQLLAAYSKQLHDAIPQGIANVLWGVARMQQQVPAEQLQLMAAALEKQLVRVDPQVVSNTAWAVGKMGQQLPARQLVLLLSCLANNLRQAKPQIIANTLIGVAYMEQQLTQQQLQPMLAALISKLGTALPQDMASTLYAVAAMGQKVPAQQLKHILAAFVDQLGAATSQNVQHSVGVCHFLPYPCGAAGNSRATAASAEVSVSSQAPGSCQHSMGCGHVGYSSNTLCTGWVHLCSCFSMTAAALQPRICATCAGLSLCSTCSNTCLLLLS
jgi:hypothetical protein